MIDAEGQGEEFDRPQGAERVPVTVLTGFLGSGKTSVLRRLIANPSFRDTAILINEFGEIGLDHLLIESASEELVTMSSGCLCCTMRNDVILSLRQLYKRRERGDILPFKRVVIETTGMADPAPVLHSLMTDPLLAAFYRLDGVVTVVDGVYGMAQLDRQTEAVKQAAFADRLIISKRDLASPADLSALATRLQRINPGARLYEAANGDVDPSHIFGAGLFDPATKSADARRWLNEEAYLAHDGAHRKDGQRRHHHGGHPFGRHDDGIGAFCLTEAKPLDWRRFASWIETTTARHGDMIYRLKGLLNVQGETRPIAVHAVQHILHPPAYLPRWPVGDRRSRLVFIGRDLDRSDLQTTLRDCIAQDPV